MRYLFFFFLLVLCEASNAQTGKWSFHGFVMNNAVAKPFSGKAGIVHTPFHFGVRMGGAYALRQSERYQWLQKATLGFVNQRLVHKVVQLYTENELNHRLYKNLFGLASLGVGYAHVINTNENKIYKLNEDGEYVRTQRFGQPKFMGSFALGLGYQWKTEKAVWQPTLQYQFWALMPFVNSYVPVLPNSALQVGISFQPNYTK